jgi:hypothetical protein
VICVLCAVASSADMVPRLHGSADAIAELHGYSDGVEYAALHMTSTQKPVLFVGMPIGTAGAVSRAVSSHTGSSVVTLAAGSDGVLAEHDGVLRVVSGGTIGTDQIKLELSLDNGRSFRPLRLGTATSYVLPNVNVTASFAAGTLATGDTIASWHGSSPTISTSDLAQARANLAASDKRFRSALLCGDLPNATAAEALLTQVNALATANDRHVYARASVADRLPYARMSHSSWRMTGNPTLTFAEVGATGDTIARNTGSWIADGAVVGDTFTVAGAVTSSGANNITGVIASLSASTITLNTEDLVAEVAAGCTVTGGSTLTFAEVGATSDTITRNRGSFLVDGFRVGLPLTSAGTASNNFAGAAVTAVTATVLTLNTQDLVAESKLASAVTLTAGETKTLWMAGLDAEYANVDDEPRLDLSAGRGAVVSPYSSWKRRVPAGWGASLREYNHDLHVATWRKDLGPIGFDLFDANGDLAEWDERVDGPAGVAARFTTLRTWSNGPRGAYIAQSLTRSGDGKITSQTHNQAVVCLACNVVQNATEDVIGRSLVLNPDGTATKGSLAVIASEVNAKLEQALLTSRGEGPRASSAVWTPSPADLYNVPESVTHGTLLLDLNGTIHSVDTATRVNSSGQ